MSDEKIKPCFLCGEDVSVFVGCDDICRYVGCNECEIYSPHFHNYPDPLINREEAIDFWNNAKSVVEIEEKGDD